MNKELFPETFIVCMLEYNIVSKIIFFIKSDSKNNL